MDALKGVQAGGAWHAQERDHSHCQAYQWVAIVLNSPDKGSPWRQLLSPRKTAPKGRADSSFCFPCWGGLGGNQRSHKRWVDRRRVMARSRSRSMRTVHDMLSAKCKVVCPGYILIWMDNHLIAYSKLIWISCSGTTHGLLFDPLTVMLWQQPRC